MMVARDEVKTTSECLCVKHPSGLFCERGFTREDVIA